MSGMCSTLQQLSTVVSWEETERIVYSSICALMEMTQLRGEFLKGY